MTLRRCLFALLLTLAPIAAVAQAYCPDPPLAAPAPPIVVGTKFAPPFVMGPKDAPEGLAIDLLALIGDCLGVVRDDVTFVEFGTAEELIDATAAGGVDVAVSTLPITVADEARVDFSFPFYEAPLAVIVADRDRMTNFGLLLSRIFQSNVLTILLGLVGFMVAVALVYWRVERQSGNDFFREGALQGLLRALILAALLVFRGKADPFTLKSQGGQVFVLLLMLLGVGIVSSFTAIITSSMTLQALEPEIRTLSDLENRNVGVLSDSAAAEWAAEAGITVRPLRTFGQVQRYFDEGEIEAFVHEAPVIRYLINRANLRGVKRAPLSIAPRDYALAFPTDGALREPANLALLTIVDSPAWQATLREYFGSR